MTSLETETSSVPMVGGRASQLLDTVILRVEQVLAVAVAIFLAADVALIFFAVLARYLLNNPIGWSEEIARLFLACFTFLGMALAFRRGQHLAIVAGDQLTPALGFSEGWSVVPMDHWAIPYGRVCIVEYPRHVEANSI